MNFWNLVLLWSFWCNCEFISAQTAAPTSAPTARPYPFNNETHDIISLKLEVGVAWNVNPSNETDLQIILLIEAS